VVATVLNVVGYLFMIGRHNLKCGGIDPWLVGTHLNVRDIYPWLVDTGLNVAGYLSMAIHCYRHSSCKHNTKYLYEVSTMHRYCQCQNLQWCINLVMPVDDVAINKVILVDHCKSGWPRCLDTVMLIDHDAWILSCWLAWCMNTAMLVDYDAWISSCWLTIRHRNYNDSG
jgi:hypothetical protein